MNANLLVQFDCVASQRFMFTIRFGMNRANYGLMFFYSDCLIKRRFISRLRDLSGGDEPCAIVDLTGLNLGTARYLITEIPTDVSSLKHDFHDNTSNRD
jgi:hypothetical protein